MRVLVCGGRHYDDRRRVYDYLDSLGGVSFLVCGGAAGADNLAADWAVFRRIAKQVYAAEWDRLGRAAGPIRNQRMLDEGKPDLVVAFPGGRGTADMVRRAKVAGVRVIEINEHQVNDGKIVSPKP